jgi:hypothetical protein
MYIGKNGIAAALRIKHTEVLYVAWILALVFHPPPLGGRIQAGKLVSPRKDPPSGGRACAGLHKKVCVIALDHRPTMHKPLVIASVCLAVPCISDSCLPSRFVDEVDIITPELGLWGFVICLDTGGDHGDFWGVIASAPYTKKKGVSPMALFEDVRLAHSVHKISSIHLAPCFFKKSKVRVLRPLRISALGLLTCPLLFG